VVRRRQNPRIRRPGRQGAQNRPRQPPTSPGHPDLPAYRAGQSRTGGQPSRAV